MTENRRIVLNIVATYGRSLYALVCGIFTARWVLMSLGAVDYGLMGVVGGLSAFIVFFNGLLASAVGRFYGVSIGLQKKNLAAGVEECRRWFSLAVLIHTIIPLMLICIGYPLGVWLVNNFLNIPPDRVGSCLWVFRFVCISCFVGMVTVPYNAMYAAKQLIAELTLYSFVTTTVNVLFLLYMVTHPGDWLVRYALYSCILSVTPSIIVAARGMFVFDECRFRFVYCVDRSRLMQLLNFAWWQMFGCMGAMLRTQGVAILVNKYFGPVYNASLNVANTVNTHTSNLSVSLIGAFTPAIVNAYGAGELEKMRTMAFRACKFGLCLILLFVVPLSLELDNVMHIWLKNPPDASFGLCLAMMGMLLIDKCSVGHMIAINARGKMGFCQFVLGSFLLLTLPLAWVALAMGCNIYIIGLSMIVTMFFCSVGRVFFARQLVGMSFKYWVSRIIMPIVIAAIASQIPGFLVVLNMKASMARVCFTTLTTVPLFCAACWAFVLDNEERERVINYASRVKKRFAIK